MTLNEKQFRFTQLVGLLITYAYAKGYTLTLGDAWAKKGEGRPHSDNSFHYNRLAIDLNLFKDGEYLTSTQDHGVLGQFWTTLDPDCTWGGHFSDGNHYSYGEHGLV